MKCHSWSVFFAACGPLAAAASSSAATVQVDFAGTWRAEGLFPVSGGPEEPTRPLTGRFTYDSDAEPLLMLSDSPFSVYVDPTAAFVIDLDGVARVDSLETLSLRVQRDAGGLTLGVTRSPDGPEPGDAVPNSLYSFPPDAGSAARADTLFEFNVVGADSAGRRLPTRFDGLSGPSKGFTTIDRFDGSGFNGFTITSATATTVPEPGTLALGLAGLTLLVGGRRRAA